MRSVECSICPIAADVGLPLSRYLTSNVSGSRPWPLRVTWCHRSCDHSRRRSICGPVQLVDSVLLFFTMMCQSVMSGLRSVNLLSNTWWYDDDVGGVSSSALPLKMYSGWQFVVKLGVNRNRLFGFWPPMKVLFRFAVLGCKVLCQVSSKWDKNRKRESADRQDTQNNEMTRFILCVCLSVRALRWHKWSWSPSHAML